MTTRPGVPGKQNSAATLWANCNIFRKLHHKPSFTVTNNLKTWSTDLWLQDPLRSCLLFFVRLSKRWHRALTKNTLNPSLKLILNFRCEISQVTSVPKFWWPRVSMRPQLCVYRWGGGTCRHPFEMWQGERNVKIISDLRGYSSFSGEASQQGALLHWQYTC